MEGESVNQLSWRITKAAAGLRATLVRAMMDASVHKRDAMMLRAIANALVELGETNLSIKDLIEAGEVVPQPGAGAGTGGPA